MKCQDNCLFFSNNYIYDILSKSRILFTSFSCLDNEQVKLNGNISHSYKNMSYFIVCVQSGFLMLT